MGDFLVLVGFAKDCGNVLIISGQSDKGFIGNTLFDLLGMDKTDDGVSTFDVMI